MRALYLTLFLALAALQYRLWVGDGSLAEVWQLKGQIEQQQTENGEQRRRNRRLAAGVQDLKEGLEVIEDRARSELGMIHSDETFFQIVDE